MSNHTVCFKNLYSSFMHELPFLTGLSTFIVAVVLGTTPLYYMFGLVVTSPPSVVGSWILLCIVGSTVSFFAWLLAVHLIPTIWKELVSIPAALRRALECKGDRNSSYW